MTAVYSSGRPLRRCAASTLFLFIVGIVTCLCTYSEAAWGNASAGETAPRLETAFIPHLAVEAVNYGRRTRRSTRKIVVAVTAAVAAVLLAKFFSQARKGVPLPDIPEGSILVQEQDGELTEIRKADFLKQHLKKGQQLMQITGEELQQIKAEGLKKQLQDSGRLFNIAHTSQGIDPFVKLSDLEASLLTEGEDFVELLKLIVEKAPEAELTHRLKLLRGEVIRVKKGDQVVEMERDAFLQQVDRGGEFAQLKDDEFEQLKKEGLAEVLNARGRLHFLESKPEEFLPFIMLTSSERDMLDDFQGSFLERVKTLISHLQEEEEEEEEEEDD